jgi:hypothetical protein
MLPLLMISRSRQGSGFYHIIKNNSSTPLYNFFYIKKSYRAFWWLIFIEQKTDI